jgi:hypothetical protein
MRTDSILRRLDAVEAKLMPRVPPFLQDLAKNEAFVRVLDGYGVAVEDFLRNGLAALPRDLLRALAERLKVSISAA